MDETNTLITYANGCNGDCFQGKWCDCEDNPIFKDDDEKKDLIQATIISCAVVVISLLAGAFMISSLARIPGSGV